MTEEMDGIDDAEELIDDPLGGPADEFLDELLPEELDWRHLVQSYPRAAMLAAATVGFLVGRRRGAELLSGFLAMVTQRVGDTVEGLMGSTLGDEE